jgi:pimeloyl-ACP methyl ester carboxylesterase
VARTKVVTLPNASPVRAALQRRTTALVALALLASALPPTLRHARSAALLRQVVAPGAAPVPLLSHEVTEHDLRVSVGNDELRTRAYVPKGAPDAPGVVLLHGVHQRGIDEPRLVAFARSVAAVGVHVLTPELPELLQYRIESTTVERIADVARAHAARVHSRAVGVIGISFAGGLALMAADHAAEADAIAFVVALGAHHDLMRLTRYYAGLDVRGPQGETSATQPHPYGARVMLRQHLARLFTSGDIDAATQAMDLYLQDQHTHARQAALALSTAGQATMRILLQRSQSTELTRLLMESAAEARVALDAASPRGKLAALRVPVFLVHGERDPVIPSVETRWLAREVPTRALRRVVITPLLRHAEFPEPPEPRATWELLTFMADVLHAAEATRFMPPRTSP